MGFDVFAYKVSKLVRVLAHGWYTNGSTPVEVQICELKTRKIRDVRVCKDAPNTKTYLVR